MKQAIIVPLIRKDLLLMRWLILAWWLGGVASVVVTLLVQGSFLFGMILFVTCMAGAGVHAVMQTVVEERREKTRLFSMSLPITVRDYTTVKLVGNLAIFGVVWATLSAASYTIFFVPEGMPLGNLPFVTIVLVGIFLAYTIVLATSLLIESIGAAVTAIVGANIVTQLFLWWVAGLEQVEAVVGAEVVIWNGTLLAVLVFQGVAIVSLIAATYVLQGRKADFA